MSPSKIRVNGSIYELVPGQEIKKESATLRTFHVRVPSGPQGTIDMILEAANSGAARIALKQILKPSRSFSFSLLAPKVVPTSVASRIFLALKKVSPDEEGEEEEELGNGGEPVRDLPEDDPTLDR